MPKVRIALTFAIYRYVNKIIKIVICVIRDYKIGLIEKRNKNICSFYFHFSLALLPKSFSSQFVCKIIITDTYSQPNMSRTFRSFLWVILSLRILILSHDLSIVGYLSRALHRYTLFGMKNVPCPGIVCDGNVNKTNWDYYFFEKQTNLANR